MSKIKQIKPFLDLGLLHELKGEIELSGSGHGWFLSGRIGDDNYQSSVASFLCYYMAKHQVKIVIERAERLHKYLADFSLGKFDFYLDQHNEFSDPDGDPFDPYQEIKWLLTTDGIDDLPGNISDFKELMFFVERFPGRQKAMRQAFDNFFGDIANPHYLAKDEEGNNVMVSADSLPTDVREDMEFKSRIKRELSEITIEHSLDNYDAWFSEINRLVEIRAPFLEMLEIIRVDGAANMQ